MSFINGIQVALECTMRILNKLNISKNVLHLLCRHNINRRVAVGVTKFGEISSGESMISSFRHIPIDINPSHATALSITPEIVKSQRLSDIFRGYRKRQVA